MKKFISVLLLCSIILNIFINVSYADVGGEDVLRPIQDSDKHNALKWIVQGVPSTAPKQAFVIGWNFKFASGSKNISVYVPREMNYWGSTPPPNVYPLTDNWQNVLDPMHGILGGNSIEDFVSNKVLYREIIENPSGCIITANARIQKYSYVSSRNPQYQPINTGSDCIADSAAELRIDFAEYSDTYLNNAEDQYFDINFAIPPEATKYTVKVQFWEETETSVVRRYDIVQNDIVCSTLKNVSKVVSVPNPSLAAGFTAIGNKFQYNSDKPTNWGDYSTWDKQLHFPLAEPSTVGYLNILVKAPAPPDTEDPDPPEPPQQNKGTIYVKSLDYNTNEVIDTSTISNVPFNTNKVVSAPSLEGYSPIGSYQSIENTIPEKSSMQNGIFTQTVKLTSSDNVKYVYFWQVSEEPEDWDIIIPYLEPNPYVPPTAIVNMPFIGAVDRTDKTFCKSVTMTVDGEPVNYYQFFSGGYSFQREGIAKVEFTYTMETIYVEYSDAPQEVKDQVMASLADKIVQKVVKNVLVLSDKPIAAFTLSSGSWKENRVINVENISESVNPGVTMGLFTLTEYEWSFAGDTSKLNKGTDTDLEKQLQYSEPGEYSVTLKCKASNGMWSDPFTLYFTVQEDKPPTVVLSLIENVVSRKDTVSAWKYDVKSIDGDIIDINKSKIELWYDGDNNGTKETKTNEWAIFGDDGVLQFADFPKYKPTDVGNYEYRVIAREEFGGTAGADYLPQFINNSMKKSTTVISKFLVDNLRPTSDLYIETPIIRPNVDLFIMKDGNLPREKYTFLTNNRINFENYLLGKNIIPSVKLWDTTNYIQSKYVSGQSGSYYSDAEGYSGELPYESQEEHEQMQRDWHREPIMVTVRDPANDHTSESGGDEYLGTFIRSSGPDHIQGTADDETYDLYLVYAYKEVWSGNYEIVYDSDWYTVKYYETVYSGTVYKDDSIPYTDPWRDINADKYILYYSDGNLSEMGDLNLALSKAKAKVILVGDSTIASQYPQAVKYINPAGKTQQQVMNEAMDFIAQDQPESDKRYMLQNETFTVNTGESDTENDPIISKEMQYVHDPNYFDNPTGQEPNTQLVYSDSTGWSTSVRTTFANVGKYSIYRRVKDLPPGDIGADYSKYSASNQVDIFVHRKPVAKAILDWDFDKTRGVYLTTFVDQSYDLDHNITRAATDRGISERKLMFRKEGGEWLYYIPSELTVGTYEVRYWAEDIEGVWSDPWTMTFTLTQPPPIQFKSQLKSQDNKFGANSLTMNAMDLRSKPIPSTEWLEAFDLWTRFPYNHTVKMGFWNGSSYITPEVTAAINTKSGNDTWYNNQPYQIPARKLYNSYLPDGDYTFRTIASGDYGKTAIRDFLVRIKTPINLNPTMQSTVLSREATAVTATTSKYVEAVSVTFYSGTAYAMTANMTQGYTVGEVKNWSYSFTPSTSVPAGHYTASFTARTVNGMYEVKSLPFELIHNRPPIVTILGVNPNFLYEGDDVTARFNVTDPDMDTLTCTIKIKKGAAALHTSTRTVSPSGGSYPTISEPTLQNIPVGSYTLEVTAVDPFGASDTKSYNFTVNPLTITGHVDHTSTWKANWVKYNQYRSKNGLSTYGNDTFFTGEKYILNADTTLINSGSSVTATNVSVKIIERTYPAVSLKKQGINQFSGEMWNEDMRLTRWKGTQATFLFTVTYSNGTVKTDEVTTNIIDDEYWRLHMAF